MRYPKVFGVAALLSLTFSTYAHAWVSPAWAAQTLMEEATLVVVAKPINENVIATKRYEVDPKVYVDDVATTFEVLAVVKGAVQDHVVVLHYQRFTNPGPLAGPRVINFEPGSGKRYLMFLEQEPDGRRVAVSGLLNYADAIIAIN